MIDGGLFINEPSDGTQRARNARFPRLEKPRAWFVKRNAAMRNALARRANSRWTHEFARRSKFYLAPREIRSYARIRKHGLRIRSSLIFAGSNDRAAVSRPTASTVRVIKNFETVAKIRSRYRIDTFA